MIKEEILVRFNKSKDYQEKLELAIEYNNFSLLLAKSELYNIEIIPPDYEIWRNVVWYEGIYQISSWGNLKSLNWFYFKCSGGSKVIRPYLKEEKYIKPSFHDFGYPQTGLYGNGTKYITIHKLVAIHFVPNPNNFKQVGHIDNNPANPKWNNLEWGTQKMNIHHAIFSNRWHTGSKNGLAKLTESDIPKIREMLSEGISCYKIASMYSVHDTQIRSIKHNRTWKHVK